MVYYVYILCVIEIDWQIYHLRHKVSIKLHFQLMLIERLLIL